jgi:hypothetical protein
LKENFGKLYMLKELDNIQKKDNKFMLFIEELFKTDQSLIPIKTEMTPLNSHWDKDK